MKLTERFGSILPFSKEDIRSSPLWWARTMNGSLSCIPAFWDNSHASMSKQDSWPMSFSREYLTWLHTFLMPPIGVPVPQPEIQEDNGLCIVHEPHRHDIIHEKSVNGGCCGIIIQNQPLSSGMKIWARWAYSMSSLKAFALTLQRGDNTVFPWPVCHVMFQGMDQWFFHSMHA